MRRVVLKIFPLFVLLFGILGDIPAAAPAAAAGVEASREAGTEVPRLNVQKKVLAVGNSLQLKVSGNGKVLSWKSQKTSRAKVSKKGKVTARSTGRTVIKAKLQGGRTLSCVIWVRPKAETERALTSKGRVKKQYGERYYVFPDNSMLTGSCPVGNHYYVFDENGALQKPEEDTVLKIGKKFYAVSTAGRAMSGWQILDGKLYFALENGEVLKDRSWQGIYFGKDGAAQDGDAAEYQRSIVRTMRQLCTEEMTDSQKIRACWNYVTNESSFVYYIWPTEVGEEDWVRKAAYQLLETGRGDCYNFACAFAALAGCAGIDARVVYGRVSGSRDHADDGLTRHAWVMIDGCYYDPEAEWAGWYTGVYGADSYDIRHESLHTYEYWE